MNPSKPGKQDAPSELALRIANMLYEENALIAGNGLFAARIIQAELSKEPGTINPNMPHMKDGTPILLGDRVWFTQEDFEEYPYTRAVNQVVESISAGKSFREYKGQFTILCDDWEGGNHECYRTEEEVPLPAAPTAQNRPNPDQLRGEKEVL